MAHDNNPRSGKTVVWQVGSFEILLKPLELASNLVPAILSIIVKLGGVHDHVSWPNIHRVKVVVDSMRKWRLSIRMVSVSDHSESIVIMTKVSVLFGKNELSL